VHRLTRKRHLTGLRGDVDDAAESSLAHRRERCSTGEERASQVDVERSLKCGERYLFDRGVGLSPAGIVDEEVHPTELLDCRRGDRRVASSARCHRRLTTRENREWPAGTPPSQLPSSSPWSPPPLSPDRAARPRRPSDPCRAVRRPPSRHTRANSLRSHSRTAP